MFFPNCSTVIWGALMLVISAPRVLVSMSWLVASAPRYSQTCHQCSQACRSRSHMFPVTTESHCIGSANLVIWPHWDSGLTTLRHSHRLLVTKIHFADAVMATYIGEIENNMLPAWSWKSASKEGLWFLALNHTSSTCHVVLNDSVHSGDQFYKLNAQDHCVTALKRN
jgi:hypothetical protein